jgi:aminopeptidase N
MPRRFSTLSRRSCVALALAAGLSASPAFAQEEDASAPAPDPRVDEAGRDVGVFPPDPLFEHVHSKLVMDIPDMSQPRFSATAELTVRPIAVAREGMTLRAGDTLTVKSVLLDGAACTYTHAEGVLKIVFPAALGVGKVGVVTMAYDAEKPGGGGAGLTWSKDNPQTPEEDFMFHSQGQPESNHRWFPCHDFPNVRLTTELVVTVPKDYEALSNGRLVEMKRLTDGSGRTTFHWRQDQPHSYYLVSLIVSKFDVVNVGGNKTARPGLWMPVYGPLGSGDNIRETFANTPEMVALYEELFDEAYPYDKYAQSIARDFSAGAMENTSATTFAPFAATARGNFLDGIIAHELVHQWFGDMVGYKSWEHLWLGEGWATFGEALWAEHKNGETGYQRAILGNMRRERGSGRNYAPRNGGMMTNRYGDPQQRFMSTDNVYSKGGFILHMLRSRLGDEAFWKGVALYLDRYRFKLAETDDFRRCLEETSGQSLERFFDQWVKRPGNPQIEADYTWDESDKVLRVVLEQTQRIDADNPAYAITVPVEIQTSKDGPWKTVYVNMDARRAEATLSLDAKPEAIELDSGMTVLMRTRVRQPLAALLRQAEQGRTYYSRMQAVDALGEEDDARAVALLERVAGEAARAGDETMRELAAASLAAITTRVAGR